MKQSLNSGLNIRTIVFSLLFLMVAITIHAATGTWKSTATGTNISYKTTDSSTPAKDYSGNFITVVYLENPGFNKIGGNTNTTDVNWLLSKGYRVIELDYANNSKAIAPAINADIIAINDAIAAGSFCGYSNCSNYRSYVLFEGYRISRDVPYFVDDPTVYNYQSTYTVGDSLRMDIIYPANSAVTVPVILSFSYSNSYPGAANMNQRLNLGNTLAGFNDSFLEGAPANGIAWAIADHPKYCPWGNGKPTNATNNKAYSSYETNPDAAQKVKSAVRTLRVIGNNLGLSGKIGIYGFSRGSTAGSMAVGDKIVPEFENAGFNVGTPDNVQVAALGSGVFDYTQIYNSAESDAGSLLTYCPLGWGDLSSNYALWQSQGSYNLLQTSSSAPVIFFYNTDDAQYYQDQIKHFKSKLDSLSIPDSVITNYGTGHAVPQTSAALSTVYDFFKIYLTPPFVNDSTNTAVHSVFSDNNTGNLSLILSPNPASDELKLNFVLPNSGKVEIEVCNLLGKVLFQTEKMVDSSGLKNETIQLDNLKLIPGIYYAKVSINGKSGLQKFLKK